MPTQMYMNTYAHKRLYIYIHIYIYMYNVLGYCIHMLLWFNFACSDVLSWWFECMFHVAFYISEVGRVGTCSFPMLWCVFRSRPTHTSFPTLRWGTIQQSSRLYIMKEQFLCAKVSIVKCNDDCDAMQHHPSRLNSPLIAVAENKCRAVTRSQFLHVSDAFAVILKISQIDYLRCCMLDVKIYLWYFHLRITYMCICIHPR
jgi:hypothetical protein